jgi:hypothetical protein
MLQFPGSSQIGYNLDSIVDSLSRGHSLRISLKKHRPHAIAVQMLSVICVLCSIANAQSADNPSKIEQEQSELADRYRQLESKLFSLHQFEKQNNPSRSKLLQQAFLLSQEKMTASQLDLAVKFLQQGKLKDAEGEQAATLKHLNDLLKHLQAEDRDQQIRDDIKRYQEYAKELDRILRIQRGLRGQTEGGVDAKRLSNSQGKASDRAGDLADKIAEDEGVADEDSAQNSADDQAPNESDAETDSNSDPASPADGVEDGDGSPSEDPPSENSPSEGSSGKGEPGEGSPSEGEPSDSSPSDPSEATPQDDGQHPVQQKMKAAQKRMDDAQKALDDAKRDNAIESMEAAEKQLAEAKKQLEEILRQLREEEVDSKLKLLEERFRGMLEQQIRINESTVKLSSTPVDARSTEFEIAANKLANAENSIAVEAGRALVLLKEDGSSIAFPVTVQELQRDMVQVADRLATAKVNEITIGIEEDIADTLNELIAALVKTQQDNEQQQQSQQSPPQNGKPGDAPLVDRLAELKMLKSLQQRIHLRHQRYAKLLDNPDDPVGVSEDPDVIAALDRLTRRQEQLTTITRQLVNEENK